MSEIKKTSGSITASAANDISMAIKSMSSQSLETKGVKAAQLNDIKDKLVDAGLGDYKLEGSGKTVTSLFDDMAKMAAAQEAGKPLKGSDKAWEADMAAVSAFAEDVTHMAGAAESGARMQDQTAQSTAIATAAGNGSADADKTKAMQANRASSDPATQNITASADKAYQSLFADKANPPTPEQIGSAQRDVMLAFQIQYPGQPVAKFTEHMNYVADGAGQDSSSTQVMKNAVATASYSDIAAQSKPAVAAVPEGPTDYFQP